jgi:hypothetical protein
MTRDACSAQCHDQCSSGQRILKRWSDLCKSFSHSPLASYSLPSFPQNTRFRGERHCFEHSSLGFLLPCNVHLLPSSQAPSMGKENSSSNLAQVSHYRHVSCCVCQALPADCRNSRPKADDPNGCGESIVDCLGAPRTVDLTDVPLDTSIITGSQRSIPLPPMQALKLLPPSPPSPRVQTHHGEGKRRGKVTPLALSEHTHIHICRSPSTHMQSSAHRQGSISCRRPPARTTDRRTGAH